MYKKFLTFMSICFFGAASFGATEGRSYLETLDPSGVTKPVCHLMAILQAGGIDKTLSGDALDKAKAHVAGRYASKKEDLEAHMQANYAAAYAAGYRLQVLKREGSDDLLGLVGWVIHEAVDAKPMLWCDVNVVETKSQNTGLGTAILELLKEEALRQGADKVGFATSVDYTKSRDELKKSDTGLDMNPGYGHTGSHKFYGKTIGPSSYLEVEFGSKDWADLTLGDAGDIESLPISTAHELYSNGLVTRVILNPAHVAGDDQATAARKIRAILNAYGDASKEIVFQLERDPAMKPWYDALRAVMTTVGKGADAPHAVWYAPTVEAPAAGK